LAQDCLKEADQRVWFLLAIERATDLRMALPERKAEVEQAERIKWVQDKLVEATANKEHPTKRGPHRFDCDDIIALYQDHADPDFKPLVTQAKLLLQELVQPR
jgi:hypothetical protein